MIRRFVPLFNKITVLLQGFGSLLLLLERFWMARIFFKSGLVKISDWPNTMDLFTNEYHVPVLPLAFAATSATCVELTCPVFLIFGLATRLATLPMLAMTAVIGLTYDNGPEPALWAMLLATLLCFGPGKISADHFIRRKFSAGLQA